MKLLSTLFAVSAAVDLPLQEVDGEMVSVHRDSCLFPTTDFPGIFADKFSDFSFDNDAARSDDHGNYYPEGTTLTRQCPAEGSCRINADKTMSCDMSGKVMTYPCQFNSARKMYAFTDSSQKNPGGKNPRTIFFRKKNWDMFMKAGRDAVLCPGYGRKKIIAASDDAAATLCGAKPVVPNSKAEWMDVENRGVPATPKECTLFNDDGSTYCAVGCKPKMAKGGLKTLNLTCVQKKFGQGDFKWWSEENGKLKQAGKRLLKPHYWCVPDKEYVPEEESSGEGSGEGSGANAIEDADVSM
jgi:hypothetical protein